MYTIEVDKSESSVEVDNSERMPILNLGLFLSLARVDVNVYASIFSVPFDLMLVGFD